MTAPFEFTDTGILSIEFSSGARAFFSSRQGGVSQPPYAELNLGPYTEDSSEALAENRRRFASAIGVSVEELRFCRQVHGNRVVEANVDYEGVVFDSGTLPEADGCVTAVAGVVPVAVTADCLPIALASSSAVCIVHAGWRGIANGVLEAGVEAVREIGRSLEIEAAIGPGAGSCCYEVGQEVWQAVGLNRPTAERAKIDLKRVAAERLERLGVSCIYDAQLCTICSDPTWFFSYRRDGAKTGRQSGAVMLGGGL